MQRKAPSLTIVFRPIRKRAKYKNLILKFYANLLKKPL